MGGNSVSEQWNCHRRRSQSMPALLKRLRQVRPYGSGWCYRSTSRYATGLARPRTRRLATRSQYHIDPRLMCGRHLRSVFKPAASLFEAESSTTFAHRQVHGACRYGANTRTAATR